MYLYEDRIIQPQDNHLQWLKNFFFDDPILSLAQLLMLKNSSPKIPCFVTPVNKFFTKTFLFLFSENQIIFIDLVSKNANTHIDIFLSKKMLTSHIILFKFLNPIPFALYYWNTFLRCLFIQINQVSTLLYRYALGVL